VGLDLAFEMVRRHEHNQQSSSRALLGVADVRELPCRADQFDVIWCRLAAGYLPEIEPLYRELARVARSGAHIIVTDFHPAAARQGHTRSFRDAHGELHTIEHFVHDAEAHIDAAARGGLAFVARRDPQVGPEVRDFYEAADRLPAYEQQVGLPLVLALAFRA
jgi:ubiquinone/menaquinone biosynthesis C-methylase UbiE